MIEIPGYRILRPLGRGGMATIYLAIQESVERAIALKVMSPMLAGEREFGERFLREARIAAKLQHRNVVAVHDVGRHGDLHYIAMEHLPGGPVHRAKFGTDVAYALRVTREIAAALDYAHARGVVHRDIKPDNMLLREDGTAVLTDFGIARANDSLRLTETGAVVGTPQYMSPEQARGKELDGRADLYSLGIVLYELLTGSPPYQATDPVAIGIMHTTAPRPVLPADLARLQPLLNQLLAISPERRLQRGSEVMAAIQALEEASDSGSQSEARRPLPPPSAKHYVTSPPPANDRASGRQEPNLSQWESLDLRAERRPGLQSAGSALSPTRRRSGLLLAVALLSIAAAGLWLGQDQLRDWLPQTVMDRTLAQAQEALAQGRVQGEAGAVAKYRAMLAMDPENSQALQGLREAGEISLKQAEAKLDAGDAKQAARLLELARGVGVAESQLQPLVERLRAPVVDEELEAMLLSARQALAEGRLRGADDSAAALFARALQHSPEDSLARRGMADTQAALLALAMQRLQDDDLQAAASVLADVESLDKAHPGIPAARAEFSRRDQIRRSELELRLAEAAALLDAGRLVDAEDNARSRYRALLQEDATLEPARQGLQRIASKLLDQAERRAADFELDAAERLLGEAARTWPDHSRLLSTRRKIDAAAVSQQRLATLQPSTVVDTQKVSSLLQQAAAAAANGNLLAPPGASAYDLYRVVLSLAPDNAEANQGMAALAQKASGAATQALDMRQLARAEGYIQALQTLDASDAALPALRHRLAGAYLALAVERLEGGRIKSAGDAVQKAREIDANHPDLTSMMARLEQAGG